MDVTTVLSITEFKTGELVLHILITTIPEFETREHHIPINSDQSDKLIRDLGLILQEVADVSEKRKWIPK